MRTLLITHQTAVRVGGVESRLRRLSPLLPDRGWRLMVALCEGRRFHDASAFRTLYPDLETVVLDGRTGTPSGDGA